ncbi:CHAT domain-containing protein [Microbacterium sp. G2-8]|uniref:CHAT domain-containing protein n=1 Tax=Microbacterium sp. G2-8 TaxID=2842454 RepID=UPI001C893961|nr:CHAT domain-containing protein [Microbacterium sp. G2-8]
MKLTAEELHQRAIDDVNGRRLSAGEHNLDRAEARAQTNDVRARIAATRSYALSLRGAHAEAERASRAALRLRDLGEQTRAILHGELGAVLLTAGRWKAAISSLDIALAMLDDSPQERANLLMNRATANMDLGALDDAMRDCAEAVATFTADGDTIGAAQARHNLGYVAMLRGDLALALREMSAVRDELERESPALAAIAGLDRAEVLREAGQLREAEALFERVARTFGAQRMRQSRAEAEFRLAQTLLAHDPGRAAGVAKLAAKRFRAQGSTPWALRADGVRLRALLAPSRRRFAQTVSDEVRASCVTTARALLRLGFRSESRALRFARDAALARAGSPPRVTPRADDTAPLNVRLLAFEAQAAQAAARGDDAGARRAAYEGIAQLAGWQRTFGSIEMLSSAAMHGTGVFLEGIDAAVRSGDPEIVFEWSEITRHFSQQVTPVRPPRDDEHAADLSRLRSLRAELDDAAWDTDPRVIGLRQRVSERRWMDTQGQEGPAHVTLGALRAALDEETALMSFVYVRERLLCLVVPHTAPPRIVDLSWRRVRALRDGLFPDLNAAAETHGTPTGALVRDALDVRLADLSDALLVDALRVAGDPRRVIITAPGELQGTPWSILPAMRGRVMTLSRSASRWVNTCRAARPIERVGFAVGPDVPRGGEEARDAADIWRRALPHHDAARVLDGATATVDAVSRLARDVDVLHIVAHGHHSIDSPMLSACALADGSLFGYDVDEIPSPPEIVLLSACELGRSSVQWGEEAVGMTRAWLHSGVRTVIASPVVVADDVACDLLCALHEHLADGAGPAEALALAAEETGHLAPFLCYGSGF